MIRRNIEDLIRRAKADTPVVLLTGARQTGKTTTTLRSSPTHVDLPAGGGGLDRPSMAKYEQVTTLDKRFLVRGPFAGLVIPGAMREIEKAVQRAIGILVP